MNHAFSMTDLGLLSQFLGLKIAQSQHGIKLHQSKYALDLLNKFNMKDCKPSKTPFLSGVKLEEVGSSPMVNDTPLLRPENLQATKVRDSPQSMFPTSP